MAEEMVAIGVVLVLVGAALLVAEAHLPAGILGVAGAVALAGGAALAIAGAGAGLAIVLAAAVSAGALAALWVVFAARKAFATRALRVASGPEAMSGHTGVVRNWNGEGGQVLVDGALWRAQRCWNDEDGSLTPGDHVVVERVKGLTLAVRKAEEWETVW
ncbi:MAG: NfeD family protein [Thermoleophilaceae bacterium]|jgi:membrane-bound ClpP family serine protease